MRYGCMKDGLARLPDHVVAHLMRALTHVRHTPQNRLLLIPPDAPRGPVVSDARNADYDVCWRGRKVGRVWRYDYVRNPGEGFPWHWSLNAEERKSDWGHCLTLHEAMEQFRNAWDLSAPDAQESA
jgi:hypothetical protein